MENNIDLKVCTTCKLCMDVCPCKVIGVNNKGKMHFIPGKESICIRCGQCMAICNTKAIKIDGYSYEKNFVDLPENDLDYTDYINFISKRRSVRNYKDKSISNELINRILESISYAPFGASPEHMCITVINNRKTIESALPLISKFLNSIVQFIENPIVRFFIKRKAGIETFNTIKNHIYPISKSGNYKLEEGDRITRGAPALIVFHAEKGAEAHTSNALIYATYAMMAAESLGLGSLMNEIVPAAINKLDEVKKIFQIPMDHEAVISLNLGYPKYKYKRGIKRNYYKVNIIN
ncbi:MAG: hypothetical protein C0597_02115 [Marinilabiliales bacterium]|nr:MAG: hypothetical protein C0597_02115 [Marinilabiliales bacterium]